MNNLFHGTHPPPPKDEARRGLTPSPEGMLSTLKREGRWNLRTTPPPSLLTREWGLREISLNQQEKQEPCFCYKAELTPSPSLKKRGEWRLRLTLPLLFFQVEDPAKGGEKGTGDELESIRERKKILERRHST